MSRRKDADKRHLILAEAKRMFADKGFDRTSMGPLAERIGIPVGSLYTYFDSKESLLNSIIEEGWGEFRRDIEAGMAEDLSRRLEADPDCDVPLAKLSFLVRRALPELFRDVDLIAILFSQADRTSHLSEMLDYLASMIAGIVAERGTAGKGGAEIPSLKAGLAVMLLGSLATIRLIRRTDVDIEAGEVTAFLAATVEAALGCPLPPDGAEPCRTDSSPAASA